MTRTNPTPWTQARRWLWAAAAALLVLTGCANKGGGSSGTDGTTPPSQLDSAAPGLKKCDKRGSQLCDTAVDAAEALLMLAKKKQITAADICPKPGGSDGTTPPSQLDSTKPLQENLAQGLNVLNETIYRTQCVQACGGTAECCTCCAQPTRNPAGLAEQCRKTVPTR